MKNILQAKYQRENKWLDAYYLVVTAKIIYIDVIFFSFA